MTKFSKLALILIMTLFSCHGNRLKVSEKELDKEIIIQENQKTEADRIAHEKMMSENAGTNHKVLRYKENRSVDPTHPPVKIDIAGNLNNIRETRLSDIASAVTYIRMEPIPDPSVPTDLRFRYYTMDNYIAAVNFYGIHLYTKDGKYIRRIVKNEYSDVKMMHGLLVFQGDYTLKGGGVNVWAKGNDLYYVYGNNVTGQKYILKYDCSSIQVTPDYKFDPEYHDKISGLGTVAVDLNHGNAQPPRPSNLNFMFGGTPESFFKERTPFTLDMNTYTVPSYKDDKMMVLLNNNGDTVSIFSALEKVINYTKEMQRGTDEGTQYEYNGNLYFRPEFNDTVFQVLPPNRLLPLYVLNLGTYKVAKQLGIDPDVKLTGKIIPGEWADTRNFIYMTFTKDDYDCPNTRKNKTVKIFHALYSKLTGECSVIKGDPFNYSPEIIENNLDGGVPVWPLSYMVGNSGELLISLKGKELKDRIVSQEFKSSYAPEVKKKDLELFAKTLSDNDDVLMIVK